MEGCSSEWKSPLGWHDCTDHCCRPHRRRTHRMRTSWEQNPWSASPVRRMQHTHLGAWADMNWTRVMTAGTHPFCIFVPFCVSFCGFETRFWPGGLWVSARLPSPSFEGDTGMDWSETLSLAPAAVCWWRPSSPSGCSECFCPRDQSPHCSWLKHGEQKERLFSKCHTAYNSIMQCVTSTGTENATLIRNQSTWDKVGPWALPMSRSDTVQD